LVQLCYNPTGLGELAALLTALCWALSSIFFTSSSREVGALAVNRVRLIFAVVLLSIAHTVMTGSPFPTHVEGYRWMWLGLSGVVGLILGDTLLFKAYSMIGNRLGTLIMAAVPVISTLGAVFLLGEIPALLTIIGIVLCVGGIVLVVAERKNGENNTHHERRQYLIGVLCALGGAIGQAGGLVLAKKALGEGFPSISATLIRMVVAMVIIWVVAILGGQAGKTLKQVFERPKIAGTIAGGSFIGPFIGVWMSQIAIQATYVGVASTLMSMMPIFMLPISHWFYKEKISPRALVGTVVALAGVAVMFF
jgi:drug/metabolite transporter (DMT)-like permease